MKSGCYRCGLPDGDEVRLCETCYRMRFHKGRDVVDLPPGVPLEGLEFSPRMRVALLSLGGFLYVALLGFFIAVHATTNACTNGDPHLQITTHEQHPSVVKLKQSLGSVRVAKS